MKYIINLLKVLISGIIITIIFSFLSFKNIISDKTLSFIQIISILIIIFIISFQLGRKQNKNGYLEGIKFGIIVTASFLIINLLLRNNITRIKIIYYLSIIIISILGSIIGINKKTKA